MNPNGANSGPQKGTSLSSHTFENISKRRISYTNSGKHHGGFEDSINIRGKYRHQKNPTVKIKINDKLAKSSTLLPGASEEDYIHLEDYDADLDA